MGFLVAFNRKMYLTSYVHSIEVQLTARTEEKLDLTKRISQLVSNANDIGDPDSKQDKQLKAEKARIEAMEKEVDMEVQKLQTQLQAAQTELQSADSMLQQNIQRSFSYGLSNGR